MRSSTLDDLYVCDLIERSNLTNLDKLLIVVPGLNNLPNILKLTTSTFNFVLQVGIIGLLYFVRVFMFNWAFKSVFPRDLGTMVKAARSLHHLNVLSRGPSKLRLCKER